ncbi:MAG TPA: hypothetical protein VLH75_12250 [Longimicrobiales bacterium]|nr:hypothetical protein [Longimicrobiales bacterium]
MTSVQRNTWVALAAIAVAFVVGSGWQFSKAREARMERDALRQEAAGLRQQQALDRLEATLAMAIVATQFGDFERGRQLASDFFALLQEGADAAPGTARPAMSEMLARRDGVITMLSRAQPESGLELAALLTWLQNALGKQPTVPAYQQAAPPGGAQE